MIAQPDRIKALILKIDEALSLSNPRPPLVVMGDSIVQSRQVLEQVRSYLLSQDPSSYRDDPNIVPGFSDPELQSPEQSLRSLIREELREWQTEFTETIQAEIRAMRQERRVLIRELRLLRKHQEAETVSKESAGMPPAVQSPPPVSAVFPAQETYIYPAGKPPRVELYPYAGVELPPSLLSESQLDPSRTSLPEKSVPQNDQPEAIASQSDFSGLTNPEGVSPEPEISGPSPALEPGDLPADETTGQNDPARPKAEIFPAGETENALSPPGEPEDKMAIAPGLKTDQEVPQKVDPQELIASKPEASPRANRREPAPAVISLDEGGAEAEPDREIGGDVFGVLDLSELASDPPQALSSAKTSVAPMPKPLDEDDYIHASPNENLLPRVEPDDDHDEDQVDTHLMVGKSIRQQLEEDLFDLEQQSFMGEEEDPASDFSGVDLTPGMPEKSAVKALGRVESFEDLWSQTADTEVNPFAEASASEMSLEQLLTSLDPDRAKTANADDRSDSEDLNFEALNQKLQP